MDDIKKHKWGDHCQELKASIVEGHINVEYVQSNDRQDDGATTYFEVHRDDAIAIAKHFNLIEETETDYLLTGKNGDRLRESIGQMDEPKTVYDKGHRIF